WGDYSKKHIPYFVNHLAPKGVVYNNFYNDGITNTVPGHAAITTGFYQNFSGKLDFYLHTSLLLQRIVDKWSVNYWNDDHSSYKPLGYENTEIIINPFVGYGITLKVLRRLSVTQTLGAGYFLSSIDGEAFDNPGDVDKYFD